MKKLFRFISQLCFAFFGVLTQARNPHSKLVLVLTEAYQHLSLAAHYSAVCNRMIAMAVRNARSVRNRPYRQVKGFERHEQNIATTKLRKARSLINNHGLSTGLESLDALIRFGNIEDITLDDLGPYYLQQIKSADASQLATA